MSHIHTTSRALALVVMGSAVIAGCGSGGSGIDRFPIEGQVTFENAPVPSGTIMFEPDAEQGNQGPAAMADIKGGRYRITKDKGVVGGPHLIRVLGYGADAGGSEADGGSDMLFPEFSQKVDIDKKPSILDVDVPAEGDASQ